MSQIRIIKSHTSQGVFLFKSADNSALTWWLHKNASVLSLQLAVRVRLGVFCAA